jgi:8-oxo-dGTP pyrophosphatase MutT (NUDIX family)
MSVCDKPRCGCIIYNTDYNDVLVVQQKASGFWGFPKGGMEYKESFHQCAQRETIEEIGVYVPLTTFKYVPAFSVAGYIYFLINTRVLSTCNPKPDREEILDYKWVSIDELTKMTLSKKTYGVVAKLRAWMITNGMNTERYKLREDRLYDAKKCYSRIIAVRMPVKYGIFKGNVWVIIMI